MSLCRFLSKTFVALAALVVMTAVADTANGPASAPANLKVQIGELKGTFQWRPDLGHYEYSEQAALEEILAAGSANRSVDQLVDCLDDTAPSASTLDGKPVALGIVCYEALTQLVYYEPTAPNGDVDAHWSGYLSPRATVQEMRRAKVAWKRAKSAKLLIFQ